MRLQAKELKQSETKKISIGGQEPWLKEIYATFSSNDAPLTGEIDVKPEAYGTYQIHGRIDYTPIVECSRCAEPVAYPIHRDIDVRFIDRDAAEAGFDIEGEADDGTVERELESQDLDTYYVEEDGLIDIELVLNDFVQTALPTRVTCALVDKTCGISLQNEESGLVHKDKNDVDTSPFAALKNLKLPDA